MIGIPRMASARIGEPPIAYTSLSALAAAMPPEIERIVDDRHEEIGGGDHRLVVVETVDRRVVGRFRADQQLREGSGGRRALEQVAQHARGDLAAAAAAV